MSDINNKKSKSILIEKINTLTNQKYKFNLQNVFERKKTNKEIKKTKDELFNELEKINE
ncbi:MAG: hypothetical protein HWN80_20460 [Candidatus Lokiarchaeota archaeon]|nr:hypothetical protein [Candidatus Lokiarchaeota archaeon]